MKEKKGQTKKKKTIKGSEKGKTKGSEWVGESERESESVSELWVFRQTERQEEDEWATITEKALTARREVRQKPE